MLDSKRVIYIDAPDPVKACLSVREGFRNCDQIWINMKGLKLLEATLFFIRNLNELVAGAQLQDVYVITDETPQKLYTKIFFVHNLDRPLKPGIEDLFYFWNLDKSMEIDKAISLGYKRFYSTKIFSNQVTNMYHNSNVLHVASEFHYNFLPYVEGLDVDQLR